MLNLTTPTFSTATWGIPQPETERVLAEHLASCRVTVERPVTFTSFQQNEDGISVVLTHSDESPESVCFQYVIGCDGAHSAVRHAAGIPFEGDRFLVDFMLGDVVLDCDLPPGMMLRSINVVENGPPDFLVAVPLPQRNRYRVSMLAPQNSFDSSAPEHGVQGERGTPSREQLQVVADRLLPVKISMSDLQWSSNFRGSMRLAERYREGRAFLAGDAAHNHPPTGGQGMNTGMQDADNLAWKIALVLKGEASAKLLDTYDEERRPVGADVVFRTRAASEQFGRRQAGPQDRLEDTQVLVNYRGSSLSLDDVSDSLEQLPVRAGDRAPDCSGLRRENVRHPLRLFDVMRGIEHVLLVYVGPFAESGQVELLERIAQKLKAFRGAEMPGRGSLFSGREEALRARRDCAHGQLG
jgi:2-polyprenyl-6-methoxyphenol hydroxylase-like FAD-dependent oxidoreductase